jgi:hypothetical protein
MAEITLDCGTTVLVDEDLLLELSQYRWRVSGGYACTTRNGGRLAMHRLVIGAGSGQVVDHANGNKLDNRRDNLRWATHGQNASNRSANHEAFSRFKGIAWDRHTGEWRAQIMVNGRSYILRGAASEKEAARLYDVLARELHGEFACVNFPKDGERGAVVRKGAA